MQAAVGRSLTLSCSAKYFLFAASPRPPSADPQYDLRLRRQPRLCRSPRGFAGVAGKKAPFIAPWSTPLLLLLLVAYCVDAGVTRRRVRPLRLSLLGVAG